MCESAAAEEHELNIVGKQRILFVKVKKVKKELNLVLKLDDFGVENQAGEKFQTIDQQILVSVENLKH